MAGTLDTRNGDSAELPLEEVSLNLVEQGRRRRQDAGGADQCGEEPQEHGEEEPMTRGQRP